ncbi:kinase-like domain-containing protein [Cyathus striatus]|nr:kinase-like domain-containing protein [Cyathus striatus]
MELCAASPEAIQVKICDFRESHIYNPQPQIEKPFQPCIPFLICAPEILFSGIAPPVPSMDIWALGVLLYMVINEWMTPFGPESGVLRLEGENVLRMMVLYLGKFPDQYWTQWKEQGKYFGEYGNLKSGSQRMLTFFMYESEYYGTDSEEAEEFVSLLKKIFRYEPYERIDAEDVVRLLPSGWNE